MMTHNELVEHLAHSSQDQTAWGEFYDRFHKHICATIARELRRKPHAQRQDSVEDLVQEVYAKLLAQDCQALKKFTGRYENSIFKYLEIIAIRVVLSDCSRLRSQKRSPRGGIVSLDAPQWSVAQNRFVDLKEICPWESWEQEFSRHELEDAIRHHLCTILAQRRNGVRDGLIFKYYLYGGMEPGEIALCQGIALSEKRIGNIIAEIKHELGQCLSAPAITP